MASIETLKKLEFAFKQPAAWKISGTLAAVVASLPRRNGQSPIRVISGREEEMMNELGYTTAWTDGLSIVFTSKFLDSLTDLGAAFVLLHECGHIAFKHHGRRRSRNPYTWNIAGDIKINDMLKRFVIPGFLSQRKEFNASLMFVNKKPLGIGFTKDSEDWLERFRKNSEEEIHYMLEEEKRRVRLEENKPSQGGGGKGKGGGGGGGSGGNSPGSQSGDATDFDFDQADEDQFDDHMTSGLDMREQLEEKFGDEGKELADSLGLPKDEDQQKRMEQASSNAVLTARQLSRSANSKQAGAHIDSYVEEAIEIERSARAKYNWAFNITGQMQESMMGHYMEEPDLQDELSDWSQIPELSQQMNIGQIFRPDMRRRMGTGNLLVVLDTSGSMSQEDLRMALVELRGICENNKVRVTFVSADTVGRDRIIFEPEDLLEFPTEMPIKGRGGTDMLTPVVQEVLAADKKFDVAVVFTDGYFTPYTFTELREMIAAEDPMKALNIPPLAFVITTDYYDNPQLNEAAGTFPNGGCRVYGLTDPELRGAPPTVNITEAGISI